MFSTPPEGFRGVGRHGDTQLDGLADGEGQVFITIAKICNNKAKLAK